MKHNRETINGKLRAYNTGMGTLTEIFEEIEAFYGELQQLDLEKWCIEHGFGKLQAIVLCKFVEDEILEGKQQ